MLYEETASVECKLHETRNVPLNVAKSLRSPRDADELVASDVVEPEPSRGRRGAVVVALG